MKYFSTDYGRKHVVWISTSHGWFGSGRYKNIVLIAHNSIKDVIHAYDIYQLIISLTKLLNLQKKTIKEYTN